MTELITSLMVHAKLQAFNPNATISVVEEPNWYYCEITTGKIFALATGSMKIISISAVASSEHEVHFAITIQKP